MKTIKFKGSSKETTVSKIVCVGQNYSDHIKEIGGTKPDFPVIFFKPTSSLIFSGDKVIHPTFSDDMHHESELVLLIGETIKDVNLEKAKNAIAAYAVGLDMTLRDIQKACKEKGQPWAVAKGFDTSAVVSEFISVEERPLEGNETLLLKVNDKIRQDCSIDKMIYDYAEVVKYLSSQMTLEEGDLVFTGTPAGVGKVVPGDIIYTELSDLVSLKVEVSN